MNEQINLQKLERKAYLTYHQDGIVDIFIGLAIITFGIILLPPFFESSFYWMGGLFVVWFVMYAAVKKSITVPRIGYVEFRLSRSYRLMFLLGFLVLVNFVLFLFMAFGLTPEVRLFLNQYGLFVVAVAIGGMFALFAWVTQIPRLYAYGVVAFIAFTTSQVFVLHLSFSILGLGLVMTCYGVVLLNRFIRKYPKSTSEEALSDPWEQYSEAGEEGGA